MSSKAGGGRFFTKLHSQWIHPSTKEASTSSSSAAFLSPPPSSSPFVFCHGLLGNMRNVKTKARKLCQLHNRPGLLLDLRGHGKSSQKIQIPPNTTTTFSDCASDIQHTVTNAGVTTTQPITLVGHSLGGRLSLQYAHDQLQPNPDRIWLLDTVPGNVNRDVVDVVEKAYDFVQETASINPVANRQEATKRLLQEPYNLDLMLAQWLASSYDLKTGQFEFDFETINDLLHDFDKQDFLHQLDTIVSNETVRVDLVRGGQNTAWQEDESTLQYLQELAQSSDFFGLHLLRNAGHWVHIDDLPGLLKIMEK